MTTPEQRESSEDYTEEFPLIAALSKEREVVGSTEDYIAHLNTIYRISQSDRANVLQLERHARFITNPDTIHDTSINNLTSAFFSGELLAYRTAELMIGEEWGDASYKMLNGGLQKDFREYGDRSINNIQNRIFVSNYILGDLEQPDDPHMPPILDEFIEQWALLITDNLNEQQHIIMGYRYIIKKITQTAAENEFRELVSHRTTDNEPLYTNMYGIQSLEELRKDIIDDFTTHYLTYVHDKKDITQGEEYTKAIDHLTVQLNVDFFKKYESLDDEDLIISGTVFCLLVNENDPSKTSCFVLGEYEEITGQAGLLSVGTIPKISALEDLDNGLSDKDLNRFGIMLEIKDPVIHSTIPTKSLRTIEHQNISLHVAISYPGMTMEMRIYGE